MNDQISIRFPKQDVEAFRRSMARARNELGKTSKQATVWSGRVICDALSNATTKSKTKRPIVKNPHPDAGKDKRRGLFGVNRWVPKTSKQYFDPIYKGGEYGQKIKWIDKKSVLLKTSNGKWEKFTTEELEAYGNIGKGLMIKDHKKTKIVRSGFAKKVWQWTKKFVANGGQAELFGVPQMAEVLWQGSDRGTLILKSNLRYAMDALKQKGSELSGILGKAAVIWDSRITKTLNDMGAR